MNHTRTFLVAALAVAPIILLPSVALADPVAGATTSATTGGDVRTRLDVRVVTVAELRSSLTVREVKDVLRANGEVRLALDLNVRGSLGGANERTTLIDAAVLAKVIVDVDADAEILADLLVKAYLEADVTFVAEVDAYLATQVKARAALQERGIDLTAVIALSADASGNLTVITR